MANSIQDLFMQVETGVTNSLGDQEIMSALEPFGYDESALNAGKALLDNTQQLHQQQLKEYGDQYSATEEFKTKKKSSATEYMRFIKIARVALKNEHAAYQKLGLSGNRKDSLTGWLAQADQFYTNALTDASVLTKLARFGVTADKLNSGKQLIDETRAASVNKTKETGEAQQSTLTRDNALDELAAWRSDFFAIAAIALEDKPQLLEKLGILKRS